MSKKKLEREPAVNQLRSEIKKHKDVNTWIYVFDINLAREFRKKIKWDELDIEEIGPYIDQNILKEFKKELGL